MTPVDLMKLLHPSPDAHICLVMLYHGDDSREYIYVPAYMPDGNIRNIRWRTNMPMSIWLRRADICKYLGILKTANRMEMDIYYSVSSYRHDTNRRISANVSSIGSIFADYDIPTEASAAFIEGKAYQDIPVPNVIVGTSQGRYQCLWLLENSLQTPEELQTVSRAIRTICRKTGGDPAVTDLARVLRLPGYRNNKRQHDVTAKQLHSNKISMDTLKKLAMQSQTFKSSERSASAALNTRTGNYLSEIQPRHESEALRRFNASLSRGRDGWSGDYAAACYLACCGYKAETISDYLRKIHPSKSHVNLYSTALRAIKNISGR